VKHILFIALFIFCAFDSEAEKNKKEEGIVFYTMNYAFKDLKISLITPEGKIFKGTWKEKRYHKEGGYGIFRGIQFPTTGKNCKVIISFKTWKGTTCRAHFLLNNYSYVGYCLNIRIQKYDYSLALFSNVGPIGEYVPLVSYWTYPQDDYIIHPDVLKKTKEQYK